jgi:pimeloyl-ACP methyl ester carboxylesterase
MRYLLGLLLGALLLPAEIIPFEGTKLVYVYKGASALPPVLLIHGWACDHTFFNAQYEDLARTHKVMAIDLPGHGASESPAKLNIDTMVRAIEAVRVHAKANRITIIGHSMGALIGREYARKYPARVSGLVSLDGSIFQLPPGKADRDRWAEGIVRMAQGFGPANDKQVRERAISVFLSNLYTDETPRELRMNILKRVLATKPETAEGMMTILSDMRLWTDETVNVPVLALRAGKQQPPGEDVFLKTLFPKLQYKFMPGMSHFLMMEQPEKVNAEINAFLKESKL